MEIHVKNTFASLLRAKAEHSHWPIIPKLTNDRDDTNSDNIYVNLLCVVKCHVKSCFRTVYVLRTTNVLKM